MALCVGLVMLGTFACRPTNREDEVPAPTSGTPEDTDEMPAPTDSGEPELKLDMGSEEPPKYPCTHDIDIVFVMDVSTSMGGLLERLEAEIGVVKTALEAYDTPNAPHFGLVVFVDDVLVVQSGEPFVDIVPLQEQFAQWYEFTSTNLQLTHPEIENYTFTENTLDAAYAAASEFPWRPTETTLRMVIHATDDAFWDGPRMANEVQIEHGYAETVERLAESQVRFFTFARGAEGDIEGNGGGSDGGSGVGSDDGSSESGSTGGGSSESGSTDGDTTDGGSSGDPTDDQTPTSIGPGYFSPYQGMPPIPETTGGKAWDVLGVLEDTISLSAAIEEAVSESYCEPYPSVE